MSQSMTYRPEVDGLRLPQSLQWFSLMQDLNGWRVVTSEVDVFFVISGYLITSIVHRQVVEGRFSLHDFYDRRLRRILPALVAVCLVTFCGFCGHPSTHSFGSHGRNLASVFLFASNIQLSMTGQGYFAPGAAYQPLQHTWSRRWRNNFTSFPHRIIPDSSSRQSSNIDASFPRCCHESRPRPVLGELSSDLCLLLASLPCPGTALGSMLALTPSKPSPEGWALGVLSLPTLPGCDDGF